MIRLNITKVLKDYYKEIIIAFNIFMLMILIINSLSLAFTFLAPVGSFTVALHIYIGNYTMIIILLLNTILIAWLILKLGVKAIFLTLPLAIAIIYHDKYLPSILSITTGLIVTIILRKKLEINIQKIITALLMIFLVIEVGTFVEYMLYIFKIANSFFFQKFHLAFFYLPYPLIPALYLIMLLSWIFYPITSRFRISVDKVKINIRDKMYYMLLGSAFALALFLGLAIYLPTLNPEGKYVGVDPLLRYVPHLQLMFKKGVMYVIKSQMGYDRPLMYIIMYLMARVFGIEATVKAMPAICSLSFAVSSYILFKTIFKEKWIHVIGTYLSICSFTTTIGLFGGLYTNWTAWSISLIAITLCFLKNKKSLLVIPLLLMLMMIHPYHWIVVQAVIFLYCILTTMISMKTIRKTIRQNLGFYVACIMIIIGLILWLAKLCRNPLIGYFNNYMSYYISLFKDPLKLFNKYWWSRTSKEVYNYGMAGYYNPISLILGIIGSMMVNFRNNVQRLTFSWLIIISVLFLAPIGVEPCGQQWRVLYGLPMGLLATFGLVTCLKIVKNKLLLPVVILQQINYSLRFIIILAGFRS